MKKLGLEQMATALALIPVALGILVFCLWLIFFAPMPA